MVTNSKAEWMHEKANEVVQHYLTLTPMNRVDELCWNRKFWTINKDPTYGSDRKTEVTDTEWIELEEQWKAGQLYLSQRRTPQQSEELAEASAKDLERLWNTWSSGSMKRQQRTIRAVAIAADIIKTDAEGKVMAQPPWTDGGSKWKFLNGHTKHTPERGFKGALLHGGDESEIFDLAEYITSWIRQVHAPHKDEGWDRKSHKIIHDKKLHVTLWEETKLAKKPMQTSTETQR